MRYGRYALVLGAGLVLTVGCRSAKTDRIRYLEAENAKVAAENRELSDGVAAERAAMLKEEARREAAEAELRATRARMDILNANRRSLSDDLSGEKGVAVGVDANGSDQILISSDITFRPGQATLTSGAEKTLAEVARVLKERPYRAIRIEGHTDSDPIRKSGWASNKALSLERARMVQGALTRSGIPTSAIQVEGRGADDPIAENTTAAGKAQNRRVVITVLEE
jgi:flagellar motor protein MotB